jgi:phosphate/sulfate permease
MIVGIFGLLMRALRTLDTILINGMVALGDLVIAILKAAASLFWLVFGLAAVVIAWAVSPILGFVVSFFAAMFLLAAVWR